MLEERFFSDETIQNILNAGALQMTIREEVSERGDECKISKKAKLMFMSECPFCKSKAPASYIDNSQGFYYCHSCGRGGNVIDFIMRYRKLSFADAVKYLAPKLGVGHVKMQETDKIPNRKVQRMYDINRDAGLFFYNELRKNQNGDGIRYFKKRGVTPQIASEFGLGYAKGGNTLINHLKSKGYTLSDMIDAGLVSKNDHSYSENGYADKFYNRVMFPILNAENKIIGFGGRTLGDSGAKYLNSPETIVFDKGKNLYCYSIAKNSKRPYFICCEGYMDAMSLHQYGYDCAVASLGTALTRDQITLLSQKEEILLAYDSDEAGVKAAKRAIFLCREVSLQVRIIRMHDAKDPDEFLKKFGTKAFDELIKNAEDARHFLVRNSKDPKTGRIIFDTAVEELF